MNFFSDNPSDEFEVWLPRLHSLVVGPGLGRQRSVMNVVTVSAVTK